MTDVAVTAFCNVRYDAGSCGVVAFLVSCREGRSSKPNCGVSWSDVCQSICLLKYMEKVMDLAGEGE